MTPPRTSGAGRYADQHDAAQRGSPVVSVVVCTDGRRDSLAALHACLHRQTHTCFEIVYVVGPMEDGAWAMVRNWSGVQGVKALRCPQHNLSMARNLGIAAAAGELVAFIDDDALPEPEWLVNLADAFDATDTAAAGGAVLDPTGIDYQFRFSAADRTGRSFHGYDSTPEEGAYPGSSLFPHVMGANCMFRRSALTSIGGFDEEFEYFLDETDVCCRLVDSGYAVRQVENALVHHKFLRNELRNDARVLLKRYPILKNSIYFALVNATEEVAFDDTVAKLHTLFDEHRRDVQLHREHGRIPPDAVSAFETEAARAWRIGLARGLSRQRRLAPPDMFASPPAFSPFLTTRQHARHGAIVLLGFEGPSEDIVLAEAGAHAREGRDVHAILTGAAVDDVSFIDNVWIRRRAGRYARRSEEARRLDIPEHFWRLMMAAAHEVERIERLRPVETIVDCSGHALAAGLALRGHRQLHVPERNTLPDLPVPPEARPEPPETWANLKQRLRAVIENALAQAANPIPTLV